MCLNFWIHNRSLALKYLWYPNGSLCFRRFNLDYINELSFKSNSQHLIEKETSYAKKNHVFNISNINDLLDGNRSRSFGSKL